METKAASDARHSSWFTRHSSWFKPHSPFCHFSELQGRSEPNIFLMEARAIQEEGWQTAEDRTCGQLGIYLGNLYKPCKSRVRGNTQSPKKRYIMRLWHSDGVPTPHLGIFHWSCLECCVSKRRVTQLCMYMCIIYMYITEGITWVYPPHTP